MKEKLNTCHHHSHDFLHLSVYTRHVNLIQCLFNPSPFPNFRNSIHHPCHPLPNNSLHHFRMDDSAPIPFAQNIHDYYAHKSKLKRERENEKKNRKGKISLFRAGDSTLAAIPGSASSVAERGCQRGIPSS